MKREINFVGNKKVFFSVSIALFALLIAGILIFTVKLDIMFKGGALITYSYEGDLSSGVFAQTVEQALGEDVTVQESGDVVTGQKNLVVSLAAVHGISSDRQLALSEALGAAFADNHLQTAAINVVSPTIGSEFLAKSMVAVVFACAMMVVYISFRFRKISGWSAGVTAVIALLNDLMVVFLVFVLLSIPLNANFIAVCLTILGYSINDTIVVYDRVRENRRLLGDTVALPELVNKSLNQSFRRTLMTSVTTIAAMAVVSVVAYFYKVSSIQSFALPLIAGMVSGFFSSICIAPNLWVVWQESRQKAA